MPNIDGQPFRFATSSIMNEETENNLNSDSQQDTNVTQGASHAVAEPLVGTTTADIGVTGPSESTTKKLPNSNSQNSPNLGKTDDSDELLTKLSHESETEKPYSPEELHHPATEPKATSSEVLATPAAPGVQKQPETTKAETPEKVDLSRKAEMEPNQELSISSTTEPSTTSASSKDLPVAATPLPTVQGSSNYSNLSNLKTTFPDIQPSQDTSTDSLQPHRPSQEDPTVEITGELDKGVNLGPRPALNTFDGKESEENEPGNTKFDENKNASKSGETTAPSQSSPSTSPTEVPAVSSLATETNITLATATDKQEPPLSEKNNPKADLKVTTSPPATAGTTLSQLREASPSSAGIRIGKGPPPSTPASEERPFDFNRFLEQTRHKSAGPVGEYLRSFLKGFTKKPYRTSDQIKLIFDFLDFIAVQMRQAEVWSPDPPTNMSAVEFENAKEGMEKLVMNRLYAYTFTPMVQKEGRWNVQTDDLERDRVLKQRIKLFAWIREEHLDIPVGQHSKGFVEFAMQELLKINHYKAPRDKLICILNCCKVIFGLIRHLSTEENADTFIPILIYVVLRANPDHLISNVEYIGRFRNPERLSSESGYYLSSLMGAVAFIETLDYSSLSNITQEEFERNVEAAVQSFEPEPKTELNYTPRTPSHSRTTSGSEYQASFGPLEGPVKAVPIVPMASSFADDTRAFLQRTGEAAKASFNTGLSKPMGTLGRLLNDGLEGIRTPGAVGAGINSVDGSPTRNDSPSPNITGGAGTSRGRLLNFFSGEPSDFPTESTGRSRPVSSYNAASWSRSFRGGDGDDEPQTPASEELRQGPFATLKGAPTDRLVNVPNAPRAVRQPPAPVRGSSIDPFNLPEDHGSPPSSGVGTPSDEGSDDERYNTPAPGATDTRRRRLPDFTGYVPNFLAEQLTPTKPATQQEQQQDTNQTLVQGSSLSQRTESPTPGEVAMMSAEVERAHEQKLNAGVETLKSIFPNTEKDVCLMVLESCNGDVQQAIDRLLEMS